MPVTWLNAVHGSDIDTAGDKGASLAELRGAGLPVPSAFIVTADTYRTFIEEAGIAKELFEVVDFDNEDSTALAAAEQRARELIMNAEWPETIQSTILKPTTTSAIVPSSLSGPRRRLRTFPTRHLQASRRHS